MSGPPPTVRRIRSQLNLDSRLSARTLRAGPAHLLIPVVSRDVQRRLFKAALDELAVIGEPVNRVLEIDLDGEDVTLTLYNLPLGP
jgi:hypothetical protein